MEFRRYLALVSLFDVFEKSWKRDAHADWGFNRECRI